MHALIALLALIGSAVADLRVFYGGGALEIGLVNPAQSHEAHEKFASVPRSLEEAEEYFGDNAPSGKPGAFSHSWVDDDLERHVAAAWRPRTRSLCAHPPTGPPTT